MTNAIVTLAQPTSYAQMLNYLLPTKQAVQVMGSAARASSHSDCYQNNSYMPLNYKGYSTIYHITLAHSAASQTQWRQMA